MNDIDALITCNNPNYFFMQDRYALFREDNCDYQKYFSYDTLRQISCKVTELTMGLGDNNRPIVVPDQNIANVMDAVYQSYRPMTSDIYSRYNIPTGQNTPSYVQQMVDQVIEIIYSDIRNNLEMERNNKKLSVWTTVLGDFNNHGLRAHPMIKTKVRRPNPMEFHMNY